jgi:hypothetical protein
LAHAAVKHYGKFPQLLQRRFRTLSTYDNLLNSSYREFKKVVDLAVILVEQLGLQGVCFTVGTSAVDVTGRDWCISGLKALAAA